MPTVRKVVEELREGIEWAERQAQKKRKTTAEQARQELNALLQAIREAKDPALTLDLERQIREALTYDDAQVISARRGIGDKVRLRRERREFLVSVLAEGDRYVEKSRLTEIRSALGSRDWAQIDYVHGVVYRERQRRKKEVEYQKWWDQRQRELLRKVLDLAREGPMSYIPPAVRKDIQRALESPDRNRLAMAYSALVVADVIGIAGHQEIAHRKRDLDVHWRDVVRRLQKAQDEHRARGGRVVFLSGS
jgi:hypothetical protein